MEVCELLAEEKSQTTLKKQNEKMEKLDAFRLFAS
jgi:hypothetical protein